MTLNIYKLSINELRLLRHQLFFLHAELSTARKQYQLGCMLDEINTQLVELTNKQQYKHGE